MISMKLKRIEYIKMFKEKCDQIILNQEITVMIQCKDFLMNYKISDLLSFLIMVVVKKRKALILNRISINTYQKVINFTLMSLLGIVKYVLKISMIQIFNN